MFYVGLDLGQSTDSSALAVAERSVPVSGMTADQRATLRWMLEDIAEVPEPSAVPAVYHLRHLERLPLGTPYPDVVAHVARLVRLPAVRMVTLAVDATGVGAPVVDLLHAAGLPCPLYAITIHGGDTVSREGRHWRVPKRDLIASTQVLLQTNRLKIAAGLPEARTLVNELLHYRVKIDSTTAHDSYHAREGAHDDVLLATALALWLAETIGDGPRIRQL